MTDRNRAVRLLLSWYLDVLPAPRSQRLADPGEVPSKRIACPDCEGDGMVTVRVRGIGSRAPCTRCGGATEPEKKGRGWVIVDAYTGREMGTAETGIVRRVRYVRCDACDGSGVGVYRGPDGRCRYCAGEGRRELPSLAGEQREARERAAEQRSESLELALSAGRADATVSLWQRGSFAELEQALGELQSGWRRLVWSVHVSRELSDLDLEEAQRDQLSRIVKWLANRVELLAGGEIQVPGVIRRWETERGHRGSAAGGGRWANGYAQGKRNAEIRELYASGEWSMTALGRKFGLTKGRVSQIVRAG